MSGPLPIDSEVKKTVHKNMENNVPFAIYYNGKWHVCTGPIEIGERPLAHNNGPPSYEKSYKSPPSYEDFYKAPPPYKGSWRWDPYNGTNPVVPV